MIGPLKSKEPHLRGFFRSAGDIVPGMFGWINNGRIAIVFRNKIIVVYSNINLLF
jgi:hypothetical protein